MRGPLRAGLARALASVALLGCGSSDDRTPAPAGPAPIDPVSDWYKPTSCAPAGCDVSVDELAVGGNHACALLRGGQVRCWGLDDRAQLGGSSRQQAVASLPVAEHLATGFGHSCALLTDGTVRCWGDNRHNQVGSTDPFVTKQPVPAMVSVPSVPTPVAASGQSVGRLRASSYVTCAILANDALSGICWGDKDNGIADEDGSDPAASCSLVTTPGVNGLLIDVAMSWRQMVVLNLRREATGVADPKLLVHQPGVVGLAIGVNFVLTAQDDGTVRAGGALGGCPSSDGLPWPGVRCDAPVQDALPGLSGVTQVAVSATVRELPYTPFACVVVADGSVQCWGAAARGQMGDGQAHPDPVSAPTPVAGLTNVRSVGLGEAHGCALTNDHRVLCWGENGTEDRLGSGHPAPPASDPTKTPAPVVLGRPTEVTFR